MVAALRRACPPTSRSCTPTSSTFDLGRSLAAAPLRVAGNLPYNVSSPILFQLLDAHRRGRADRRRDADAAARGRRADRGRAGDEGLRRAVDLRAAAGRRPPPADAAARRVPAGAQGPLGGRPPGVSRAGGRRARRASVRGDWCGRSSRSGGRRWRTRCGRSRPIAASTRAPRIGDAGIDGRRRPETLQLAELARLADDFRRHDLKRLCYSLRAFSVPRRPVPAAGR